MSDAQSLCWRVYQDLQTLANAQKLCPESCGIDEACRELIQKIASPLHLSDWLDDLARKRSARLSRPVTREEALRAWVKNLITNRSKKYRRMVPLDVPQVVDHRESPFASTEPNPKLKLVQSRCTPLEWHILWQLAHGDSCRQLAKAVGLAVTTLRSIVSRCRRRLAASLSQAV